MPSREGSQASRPSAKPAGSPRGSALVWPFGRKCLVVDFHRARGPRSRDSSIGVMKIILIQMVMVCVEKFNGSSVGTPRKTALAKRVKPCRLGTLAAGWIEQACIDVDILGQIQRKSLPPGISPKVEQDFRAGGTAFARTHCEAPRMAAGR